MNIITKNQKKIVIFGVPLLLITLLVYISKTTYFYKQSNILAIGITFDLLLFIPFIYYLFIRKTTIAKTTVVPFIIIGMIIGTIILPIENQTYLSLFKIWILPIIELSVFSFIIINVRKGIKELKKNKDSSVDFHTSLKSICSRLFPANIVMLVVTEVSVFYYGFVYWKKKQLKDNEFSYHKESGTVALLLGIILIVGIETFTLHKLLLKWNSTIAWVLTFISIYSAIQIFGFLKSIYKRPIAVEKNILYLRYGILNEVAIKISDIESIKISSKDIELNKETRKLSFFGELESHNVILHLEKEYILMGLYGIKRKFKTLAFFVDDKNNFVDMINNDKVKEDKYKFQS